MARRSTFKQADVTKALKGAVAAGMKPSGFRIDPVTGEVFVQLGIESRDAGNSFDALMGGR